MERHFKSVKQEGVIFICVSVAQKVNIPNHDMKTNIYYSYLAMFELLDDYYKENKENEFKIDHLASLLGSMDPYLFEGGYPIDQAVWLDWKNITKKLSDDDKLTENEIVMAIIRFLQFYINEFYFNLQWVIDEMLNNDEKTKNRLIKVGY